MKTLYFDWSGTKGLFVANDENDEVYRVYDIPELLDSLSEPTRLVCETTFESFNLDRRAALIYRAAEEGHEWYVTPTRMTPKARNRLGLEKTDANDARAIKQVFRNKPECAHVAWELLLPNSEQAVRLRTAQRELVELRNTSVKRPSTRAKAGFVREDAQAGLVRELLEYLPDFSSLDPVRQAALGNKTGYRDSLVASVAVAAKHAANRAEFEQIMGLYAGGYPSIFRSNINHWGWRGGNTPNYEVGVKGVSATGIGWSAYRREVRWLYHQLKDVIQGLSS